MTRDYIGMIKPKPEDRQDYGIRGMKWGVRRDSATLKSEAAKSGGSDNKNAGIKAASGEETSAARYARLHAQAKASGASSLSDSDLKFFNARTEAVAKVNKLTEERPGWFKTTSKSVLQQAAQKQMQAVVDGIAGKYISGPILDAVKNKGEATTPIAAAKPVVGARPKAGGTPTYKLPTIKGTNIFDTTKYLADHPNLTPAERQQVKLKAAFGVLDG